MYNLDLLHVEKKLRFYNKCIVYNLGNPMKLQNFFWTKLIECYMSLMFTKFFEQFQLSLSLCFRSRKLEFWQKSDFGRKLILAENCKELKSLKPVPAAKKVV